MYIKEDDYDIVQKRFFNDHHGVMVKLTAPHRKNEIFGYILRCEAKKNDKGIIIFSLMSPIYYSKLIASISKDQTSSMIKPIFKSIREVKYYGMKRV